MRELAATHVGGGITKVGSRQVLPPSPPSHAFTERHVASGERGQRDRLPTFVMHTLEGVKRTATSGDGPDIIAPTIATHAPNAGHFSATRISIRGSVS